MPRQIPTGMGRLPGAEEGHGEHRETAPGLGAGAEREGPEFKEEGRR